jgi:hypothetical protein
LGKINRLNTMFPQRHQGQGDDGKAKAAMPLEPANQPIDGGLMAA